MSHPRERFIVLADFVVAHFPLPFTRTVLDIGGSMGLLAYHLARRGYEVTVVDPRRKAVKRHYRKLAKRAGFFSRMSYQQRPLADTDSADLLVGLHPDEVTEAVIKQAARAQRPFIVVPCCVMPEDGQHRSYEEWCEYLADLAAGSHEVHTELLPMEGANLAIWGTPLSSVSETPTPPTLSRRPYMSASLWEPNFDRVLTVLRRDGEPDRVPFFELFHDQPILEAVMGRPTPADPHQNRRFRVEFMQKLGYDFVRGNHNFAFPGRQSLIADDTETTQSRGKRGWKDEHHGPIESWEDFEKYPWPRIEDASFEDVEKLRLQIPDGMKVTVTLPGGVLENLTALMGYEPLCYALVEQPDLVRAVVDKIGEGELAVYKVLADMDHVGALWLNDDLGFKTQTMISPAHLREYVFPWYRTLVSYAHEHGRLVMIHSCGNLSQVMEDLIDIGIDGKHSFEDVIQPVADFKAQYGSRISALGGIDVGVLVRATEEEVRQYTRRVLEQCAPGGGYALGSGNSVANYVPVRNFLAMLEVGKEVGVYQR